MRTLRQIHLFILLVLPVPNVIEPFEYSQRRSQLESVNRIEKVHSLRRTTDDSVKVNPFDATHAACLTRAVEG